MKILSIIKNNTLKLLFLMVLSISESYYIMDTIFTMEGSFALSCLAVFVVVVLAILIIALPRNLSIAVFALIGMGIVYLFFRFIDPLNEFVNFVNTALLKNVHVQIERPIILLFSLAIIYSFINYIFTILLDKSIISAVISILIICYVYFTYEYINLLFAIFYLVSVLLITIRWIAPQKLSDKNTPQTNKFLVPFILIIIAAFIISPITILTSYARIAPLRWIDELDWFESNKSQQQAKTIIMIDGQSKLTNLSDEFTYNDTKMMIVNSPYFERLRNKTYDTYTGEGWKKAQKDTVPNQNMQYPTYELITILSENNIPFTEYSMSVELIAQSQMVFTPLHSMLTTELEGKLKRNPYDDLYLDNPMIEGSMYSLDAVHIEYRTNEFVSLITNSKSENIDNMENYLSISRKLKESIQPLALELTKGAKSNYEKATIIESYLSSQYTYNLKPLEKPVNKDFVEYFLFESTEGFCTHYASSMVMLLRSIGIPCRYVTGYLLDAPRGDEFIPTKVIFIEGMPYDFYVEKLNSHAWVEVWFDDFGWLAYEPTSKYTSELGFSYLIDYGDFENVNIEKPIKESKSNDIYFIILGSVLALVLILAIIIKVYIVTHRSDREKIAIYWKAIKKSYYTLKKIVKKNETAREFYLRADRKNKDLHEAAALYEFAAFNNKDIALWQLIKMQKLYKKIKKYNENYKKELRKEQF